MEILVFWLVFAVIVGVIANNKGRSGIGWFLFSIVLSPLLGLIVVLVLSPGTDRAPVIGVADELTKLVALRDSGAITAN